MNIGLCRIFPGEAMAEDSSNIYQNPPIKTKHPPLSGNPFFFHPRSRFSWNFNYWTSFEIDMFTPVCGKDMACIWTVLATALYFWVHKRSTDIYCSLQGISPFTCCPSKLFGVGEKSFGTLRPARWNIRENPVLNCLNMIFPYERLIIS